MYFIYMVLFFLVICSIVVWDKREKKVLKNKIRSTFGLVKGELRDNTELDIISKYFNAKQTVYDIDKITWNDLSMDKIYSDINITNTNIGDEYLYALLHQLQYDNKKLLEREKLMELFEKNVNIRVELQIIFDRIGRVYNHSVFETLTLCKEIKRESLFPHYLILSSIFLSILSFLLNVKLAIFLSTCSLVISILSYCKTKRRLKDSYIWSIKYLTKMIGATTKICKLNCIELEPYLNEMKDIKRTFIGIKVKSFFLSSGVGFVADSFDLIFDYIRILTHIDIIFLYDLSKIIERNFNKIERLYEIIGLFESMIAVASYRKQLPHYSRPNLLCAKKGLFIDGLYHPLVKNPISNTIKEKGSILITGTNASGKSTFLKAVALNAIFSQTLFISTSQTYEGNYFRIYTSMALTDNIMSQESYFIVEIKAIKRIIDELNDKYPVLCCIDEVLRGTNTLERIAASSEILAQLAKNNAICFAATHDIELGKVLNNCFTNYHFSEDITKGQIVFNYKINHGMTKSRNAIKLLELLGYSTNIVNSSSNRLDSFIETGVWNSVD